LFGINIYLKKTLKIIGLVYSRQEEIFEQPKFTGINEDFEQILNEPSKQIRMLRQKPNGVVDYFLHIPEKI